VTVRHECKICVDFGSSRTKFLFATETSQHFYELPKRDRSFAPSKFDEELSVIFSILEEDWPWLHTIHQLRLIFVSTWPSWVVLDTKGEIVEFFSFDDLRSRKPINFETPIYSCDYKARTAWLEVNEVPFSDILPLSSYCAYRICKKLFADEFTWEMGGGENGAFPILSAGSEVILLERYKLPSGKSIKIILHAGTGDTISALIGGSVTDTQAPITHLEVGTTPIILKRDDANEKPYVSYSLPNFFKQFFTDIAPELLVDSTNLTRALNVKPKLNNRKSFGIEFKPSNYESDLIFLSEACVEFDAKLLRVPVAHRLEYAIRFLIEHILEQLPEVQQLSVGGSIGASTLCLSIIEELGLEVVRSEAYASLLGGMFLLKNEEVRL